MDHKTMFEEQAEWQQQRLGKFTASNIHKLLVSGKKKGELFGKGALTYIDEKISELITGVPCRDLEGMNAVEWGHAHEYEAIQALETLKGISIEYFGGANPVFFPHNTFSGSSPDGLTQTHAIEIKCPYNQGVHAQNLIASLRTNPAEWFAANRQEYYAQMQFQMLCTGREKGYFTSYDPRPLDPAHRLAIIEISADAEMQDDLKMRIDKAGDIVRSAIKLLSTPSVITARHDNEVSAIIVE